MWSSQHKQSLYESFLILSHFYEGINQLSSLNYTVMGNNCRDCFISQEQVTYSIVFLILLIYIHLHLSSGAKMTHKASSNLPIDLPVLLFCIFRTFRGRKIVRIVILIVNE